MSHRDARIAVLLRRGGAENERRGRRNDVSSLKLLQRDPAETWREPTSSTRPLPRAIDASIEVASGKVAEDSRSEQQEVTELWTFCRPRNADTRNWELSACSK